MTNAFLGRNTGVLDDAVVLPLAHVRIRNVSGTIIVAVGDDVVELSELAEFIWRSMDPSRRMCDIVARVASAYDADAEEVRDDVRDLLTDLGARGFVTVVEHEPEAAQ